MSNTRVKQHPTLGILIGTDGHVMLPANSKHPARWTFGSKHPSGYMRVKIDGKDYKVHRLVAQTFIGQIPRGMEVDHLNRVRDDNRVENLRIVTRSENNRNTSKNDRVDARGGTHKYEDSKQYRHEQHVRYYAENPDKVREQTARSYKNKCKTHRVVQFSDGSKHWIPRTESEALLKIPLKERVFKR